MKKRILYITLLTIFYTQQIQTRSLLRNRTIAQYQQNDMKKLLNEIGSTTVNDAQERIKGLQDLLISLEAHSIEEAQEHVESLFTFMHDLENKFNAHNFDEVIAQIDYLQSLHEHIADFEWKE